MLLKKLTITDIGTYRGSQDFDLTPRRRGKKALPIILFGGLNGAGKTTFLTAVRLALYGRQSLDRAPTQAEYEEHLLELMHRSKGEQRSAEKSSIAIEFEHSRAGVRMTYRVVRFWSKQAKGVDEALVIYSGSPWEPFLKGEQAQAFLNQLVPPGVAQFFFFDGEKIAALAKDDSDAVLADAIRRLLGLDLADRLNSDLSNFLRAQRVATGDLATQKEVNALEKELAEVQEASAKLEALQDQEIEPERSAAKDDYSRKRDELANRGGAWSVNRTEFEQQLDTVREQRKGGEEQLRELLGGLSVFGLAPKLSGRLLETMQRQNSSHHSEALREHLATHAEALKAALRATLGAKAKENAALASAIDEWILTSTSQDSEVSSNHTIAPGEIRRIIELLSQRQPYELKQLQQIYRSTHQLRDREDEIVDTLAHAPTEESLKDAFDALQAAATRMAVIEARWKQTTEEQRKLLWQQIELTRKLRRAEEKLASQASFDRGVEAAEVAQNVIAEFKQEASRHKCEMLRQHFLRAFVRLARKDDIVRDVRINPETFFVELMDATGQVIQKKRLSAGEKQIYAIAMIEALAKTSGRSLPVIIDTPLGRLDSRHRSKLIELYFPVASHQVIILSTDTEVDGKFYETLSPHISHAFHLAFDESSGATAVETGYFWRHAEEDERDAA